MTKREWKKWSDDNTNTFNQAGLTARQAAILAEAYRSYKSGNDGGRLYLPITLPDGVPVEFDSNEVCDLEDRGLIRREVSESGAKSITITSKGMSKLDEFFKDLKPVTVTKFRNVRLL